MPRRTRRHKRTASGRYGHWLLKRQKKRAHHKKREKTRKNMHIKAHREWMPLDVHSPNTRKRMEEEDFKKMSRRTLRSIERTRR